MSTSLAQASKLAAEFGSWPPGSWASNVPGNNKNLRVLELGPRRFNILFEAIITDYGKTRWELAKNHTRNGSVAMIAFGDVIQVNLREHISESLPGLVVLIMPYQTITYKCNPDLEPYAAMEVTKHNIDD